MKSGASTNLLSKPEHVVTRAEFVFMPSLISKQLVRAKADFDALRHTSVRGATRFISSREKGRGLSALSSETHGDVSESALKRKRHRQVHDDASYRDSYQGSEFEQPFAQHADLSSSTSRPSSPQA